MTLPENDTFTWTDSGFNYHVVFFRIKKSNFQTSTFFIHKKDDQEVFDHIEASKKADLFTQLENFNEPKLIGLVKGRMLPVKQKVVYKI